MINPFETAPAEMEAWVKASLAIHASVEPELSLLIQTRASQLNGCANCINMHASVARARGETEQRLHLLAAWREAPCYSSRERAALEWTDALTRLSEGQDLKNIRENLKAHFSDAEQVQITLLVNVINGFNRLSVGFRIWSDEPHPSSKGKSAVP